jgi:hypothetical protein
MKNIQRPIRIYQVRLEIAPEAAKAHLAALLLPQTSHRHPPVQDMSAGHDQDISPMGSQRISYRRSRSHAFCHRAKFVVYLQGSGGGRETGRRRTRRSLCAGGVRKGGNRIRITAQLIDATTGNHIWERAL